ncbi:MAG: hypothetical protein GY869_24835, partial [Planctomycetes bacterium]|nr:hypothetical protein [Planctomycetota bacterium]
MDWNKDGKKDLIIGDSNGYLYSYLNTGTDAAPVLAAGEKIKVDGKEFGSDLLKELFGDTLKYFDRAKPDVVDWNNDSKTDLIVGIEEGYVLLLLNTGTAAAPQFKEITFIQDGDKPLRPGTSLMRVDPRAYDFNADGKSDFVTANVNSDNVSILLNATITDADEDNVADEDDNCPNDYNPGQEDTDGDDIGNACDTDDDNDGVEDISDSNNIDPTICEDIDGDTCDDCSIGTDGFGPLPDNNPANDGTDTDADGICDLGDWICGDLNDDDNIDILDIVFLINYKYKGGTTPEPLESADVNHDSNVDILDIVHLINFKYKGG